MTEAQKEYIITEERIKKILELDRSPYDRSDEIEDLLRVREYIRLAKSDDAVLDDFDLINSLKKKYRNEMAVIDALELVEDEVMAVQREQKEPYKCTFAGKWKRQSSCLKYQKKAHP